ncbi:MAG: response regulator, partial [Pedobacter sp.]
LLIIVNDILDFSKIDSGKMAVEKIGFEPKKVIEQVMQVMRYRAEEKGLQFVNSFCDSRLSPVLIGDPYRIRQILLNLTSNAIKFTNRGYVDISCSLIDDLATNQILKITVKDSGIGMDSAFKERLFDKFSQEDDTVTRKYGGTGLGMSISKNLIELMGGSIDVESFKEKGTSISFTLNLDKGTKADIPVKEEIEIDTKLLSGKNILVVDDNEINRLLACTILENHGLTTKEAENGNEALLMLKLYKFDLILMDVQMPVMDGIEATQLIRQMDNDIPIIALTAFALKGDNQKCFEAGMNDYLAKPFEETKLLSILGKWLNLPNQPNQPKELDHVEQNQLYSLAKIESLANGSDEFIQKMISLFIKHIPIAISEFEEAYQAEDFVRISQIAHRIKPSIDNLDILGLNEMIREVETKATQYQKSDVLSYLLTEIQRKLNLVLDDLRLKSTK